MRRFSRLFLDGPGWFAAGVLDRNPFIDDDHAGPSTAPGNETDWHHNCHEARTGQPNRATLKVTPMPKPRTIKRPWTDEGAWPDTIVSTTPSSKPKWTGT